MTHWTERTFVENADLHLPSFEESELADEDVNEILSLLKELYDVTPEKILDVGCGPHARHVIPFAERGIMAHGLDVSAMYTDRARERAESAGIADLTSFFARDMRDVGELDERYDLLMNVYSFGFFDEDANEQLLRAFYERIEPGGVLLLKTFNKVGKLVKFDQAGTSHVDDVTYVIERQYDPLTSRRRSEAFVIENESYLGDYEFEVRLYTPIELAKMLTSVGFEDIHQFNTYDREELTRESEKQVILGRK